MSPGQQLLSTLPMWYHWDEELSSRRQHVYDTYHPWVHFLLPESGPPPPYTQNPNLIGWEHESGM